LNSGNYTSVEYWLSEARRLLDPDHSEMDYLRLRYTEASLYLSNWQFDKANPILLECLELANKTGDSSKVLMMNSSMSVLKSEQGLHGASLAYGQKALSYFNCDDSLTYYSLLLNLTNVVRDRDTQKSLQDALACKNYFERNKAYSELAMTLNNIGELYRDSFKEHEMAEKHYRESIAINQTHGYNGGLAKNYLNMALNFNENRQVDSSLKYINLALMLRTNMGDVGGMAIVYNNLGRIHLFNGNVKAAREAFSKSVQISEENAIYPGLYHGNLGLAKTYAQLGARTMAKQYFNLALQIAKQLNILRLIADAYKNLCEIEKLDGNYKAALGYFEEYSAYSDSLSIRENQSEYAELKTQYEADLAQKENMILRANQLSQSAELERQRYIAIGLWVVLGLVLVISLLLFIGYYKRSKLLKKEATLHQKLQSQHHTVQLQKEELKELNELKNSVFSVLGHDLRAPLTSISSLVSLMNSGDLEQEEFIDLTRYLDQETKAGLISLQNILVWSQAKMGSGKPQVEDLSVALIVDECLKSSRRQIEDKKLIVDTRWEYARIVPADKNQFKSIVSNLLSNAIKFSP